jgi:hypothetical protein
VILKGSDMEKATERTVETSQHRPRVSPEDRRIELGPGARDNAFQE